MIGFVIDMELVWGYQCSTIGLSRSPVPYLYPPPSSFLGAIAESIARYYNLGENVDKDNELMKILSEKLRAIAFRPLNFIPLRSASRERILAIKITQGKLFPSPTDLSKSFDSVRRGLTIVSSLTDFAPRIRWTVIFLDNEITIDNKKIPLDDEIFWRIHRIGSKESLVSVVSVFKPHISVANTKCNITTYSFPEINGAINLQKIIGKWQIEEYLNPYQITKNLIQDILGHHNMLSFWVPLLTSIIRTPKARVEITSNQWCFYEIKYENGLIEYVVGRR